MNYTKRARIFVGTLCNARCGFCYYILTGLKNVRPIKDIMKQIDLAKKADMEAIDFSGGEPTILPNFMRLIEYAKRKGFKTICTLTNGIRMSDKKFTEDLVNAGLNEVLFSVHGHSPEEHEMITGVRSSFSKIIQAIENVRDLGLIYRINCTVSKINYKNLEKHARLYNELKPLQVNFILFNDWETAKWVANKFCVRYSEAAPYIKRAIDLMKGVRYINVRYIPFCFMKGYEKYVTNYPQKIYDPYEWSQRMLFRLGSKGIVGSMPYYGRLLMGLLRFHPKPKLKLSEYAEDICVEYRRATYIKPKKCKNCCYYHICDGLEQSYVKIFGAKRLNPVEGIKITDPLYFRRDFY